jgi:hypothetical protein
MQREMEARLANANASVAASAANLAAVTGMKSPIAQFSSQFSNTPTFPASPGFLGTENPIPADGSTGFGSPSAQLAAQRNRNRQQNRISAPGNLHYLSGSGLAGDGSDKATRNAGYLASGHLGDLIERGTSPAGGESNASNASRSPNLGAIGSDAAGLRPKSADFATLAAAAAAMTQEQGKSPFARSSSPRFGSSALGGTSAAPAQDTMQAQAQQAMIGLGLPAATTQALNSHLAVTASPSFADQFSPLLHTNWASIGNTPMLPMFNGGDPIGGGGGNHNMSTADPSQLAAQLAAMSASASPAFHGSPGGRVILDDASKFKRTPSGGRPPPGAQSSPHLGSGNDLQSGKPVYAASHNWRSPMMGSGPDTQSQGGLSGLGIAGGGVGLGMGMGMGMGSFGAMDSYNSGGGLGIGLPSSTSGGSSGQVTNRAGSSRQSSRNNNVRKSPMIGGFPSSSSPQQQLQPSASSGPGANGGAGSGAGVSGSDDVDERILKDTANWLRVLRLHVRSTRNLFPLLACRC